MHADSARHPTRQQRAPTGAVHVVLRWPHARP